MTSATGVLGLDEAEVAEVVATAAPAPGARGTRSWWFRLDEDRIELHADAGDRELRLACGTALFNLRLALRGHGIRPLVTLLPGADAPGALATVRRGGRRELDDETRALIGATAGAVADRAPLLDTPVPAAHRHAMVRAAERERSWLHVVTDPRERALVRRLVAEAHPTPDHNPLIAVLCSFHDEPRAELQAGQALRRVLLTAAGLDLSATVLPGVAGVREELRRALGGVIVPQAVLRVGPGSPVPRRAGGAGPTRW
ncbi:nitroreductase [Saccharothrix coeruleofusca]|nr:nitroreductase [Saccharothrix coeruleofusca]MBP2335716.1 hypothetical protein [Saccharothrix coeruleofusca]